MTWEFRSIHILLNALLVAFLAFGSSLAFGDDTTSSPKPIRLFPTTSCDKELGPNTRGLEGNGIIYNSALQLYYYEDEVSSVEFTETTRDTVLLTQLKELASAVTKKSMAAFAPAVPHTCIPAAPYQLKFKRANLKIVAKGVDVKSEQSFNIVTGPEEHWHLGFDLPVVNHKTLKYDQTTKSLLPQDQNPQLYLSFNYSTADVVSAVKNPWSLKLLLQASSRPLDSVGFGIGVRLPDKIAGIGDLSALSLFAGRFWTKQDGLSAGGVAQLNQSTAKDWRFGISYDFSTALPWIK